MSRAPRGGPPPGGVLGAFGAAGGPVPLTGGQRTVWRAGDLVLKRLDVSLEELGWQEEVLTALDGAPDVRVAPPVRARDGALVVAGWTAWRFEPGTAPTPGRYPEVVAAGRVLHRHLAHLPRPALLDRRDHAWARADRIAWGEAPAGATGGLPHVAALLAARVPVEAGAQVVHGDLTDNVHLHPGLPPLVLDLTGYWRPPAYASAVVVADAVVFRGADLALVDRVGEEEGPHFPQLLLRALLFRALTDQLLAPGTEWARWFGPAVRRVLALT